MPLHVKNWNNDETKNIKRKRTYSCFIWYTCVQWNNKYTVFGSLGVINVKLKYVVKGVQYSCQFHVS